MVADGGTQHHEPSHGVRVAGTESPNVIELWDWTLGPGERHESEAHAEGTRELLQVLHGSLVVTVDSETTALGAAFLAGLAKSVWSTVAEVSDRWEPEVRVEPLEGRPGADDLYTRWKRAVDRSRAWETPGTATD